MSLEQLARIVAIARERTFRRAAEVCFVEPSTFSTSVKNLEDELGLSLFYRKGNSHVFPTPVGEQIIEQATFVLEEVAEIKRLAAEFRKRKAP